jgi:drug/metabolite transporter (DMT)-like permease
MLLVLSGIMGGIGQILLTISYRYATISTLAPFDYMSLIWAVALGFVLFGDIPHWLVLAGAALVIAAGMLVILQERRADSARADAKSPPPP